MANLSNINNKFLVTTGGNVGINTTSPGAKLDVNGATYVRNVIYGYAGGGNQYGGLSWGGTDEGFLFLKDSNVTKVNINSNGNSYLNGGNVGIGTASPTNPLSVEATNVSDWVAEFKQGHSTAGQSYGVNIFGGTSSSDAAFQVCNQAGSGLLRITGVGNVGIGTSSPESLLHIKGETRAYITFQDTSDGFIGFIGDAPNMLTGGTVDNLGLRGEGGIQFGVSDVIKMVLNSSGNLGIGTTNPGTLHGASYGTTRLQIDGGTDRGQLIIEGDSFAGIVLSDNGATANQRVFATSVDDTKYTIKPLNDNGSSTAGGVAVTVLHGGNVGIGTTSPYAFDTTATKLHVKNDSAGSGNVGEVARFEGSSDADGSGGTIRLGTSNDRGIYFEGGRTGSVPYGIIGTTEYNGAKTYSIYLQNTGNVGIGTESPDEKLDITGGYLKFNGGDYGLKGSASLTYNPVSDHYFQSSGSTKVTFKASGNVGIATTSPSYKLEVNGGTALVGGGFYASSDQSIVTSSTYTFRDGVYINNPNSTSAAVSSNSVMSIGASSGNSVNTSLITTGAVGIGTTSPSSKLHVTGAPANGVYLSYLYNSGTHNSSHGLNVQTAANNIATYGLRVNTGGDSNALAVMGNGNVGIGTASPNEKLQLAGNLNAYAPSGINAGLFASTAAGSTTIALRSSGVTHFNGGNVGIGTTSPYSLLDVDGAITNGSATNDSNISTSTTAFSQQDGGALHITWGLGGNAANGSTIVFTYAATSWKSWTLKYNFASTNGITQGVIGGYWNNSGGNQNSEDIDNLGCSAAVTHGGTGNQNIIVTFTFTALGTHPMANFVYMQAGGDGHPRADRVSIQGNNAV